MQGLQFLERVRELHRACCLLHFLKLANLSLRSGMCFVLKAQYLSVRSAGLYCQLSTAFCRIERGLRPPKLAEVGAWEA